MLNLQRPKLILIMAQKITKETHLMALFQENLGGQVSDQSKKYTFTLHLKQKIIRLTGKKNLCQYRPCVEG